MERRLTKLALALFMITNSIVIAGNTSSSMGSRNDADGEPKAESSTRSLYGKYRWNGSHNRVNIYMKKVTKHTLVPSSTNLLNIQKRVCPLCTTCNTYFIDENCGYVLEDTEEDAVPCIFRDNKGVVRVTYRELDGTFTTRLAEYAEECLGLDPLSGYSYCGLIYPFKYGLLHDASDVCPTAATAAASQPLTTLTQRRALASFPLIPEQGRTPDAAAAKK